MIKLSAFADEAGMSMQEQIQALKRNNIPYIELRWIDDQNVAYLSLEDAKRYQDIFEQNGIQVWSIGSPIGKIKITDDFEEHKNVLRHTCKVAKIFNCNRIRIFSFFEAYQSEQLVYDYLREMVEIAREEQVELYHENEKFIFGDKVERVLRIMQNVKGLKYVYDPANYIEVGEDADYSLNALHNQTDYFHIKDVISETGEIVPAGYGDGKIDKIVRQIDDDKVLSIEPHLAIFKGYAEIDGTEMKNKFKFNTNTEAFDAAVKALKDVLYKAGYTEKDRAFVK